MDGSKFVSTCHHCFVIGHIRPQCSLLKKEQNYVSRSLPKRPSGAKHIFCHYCGAFGYLRPHCSKFQALKRIKRKEKLEFFGSGAKKENLDLSENSRLLKKVFNALNSLTMCISGSHSSIPYLTPHETFTPNSYSIWVRKGSYYWALLFWSLI